MGGKQIKLPVMFENQIGSPLLFKGQISHVYYIRKFGLWQEAAAQTKKRHCQS